MTSPSARPARAAVLPGLDVDDHRADAFAIEPQPLRDLRRDVAERDAEAAGRLLLGRRRRRRCRRAATRSLLRDRALRR